MWRLLDRYILLELSIPFGLTLAALMMILLTEQMLRLVELLINKGVSLFTVVKVFVFLLPAFLVIAVPVAVLIATIIAFSRLTADNEITALKAGGISLIRMSRPVHLLAAAAFIMTFSLSVWAQPWIGRSLKTVAMDVLKQEFSLGLEPGIFNEPFDRMMIYVDEIPAPGRLRGIVIYDLREASQPALILAREGMILNDPASDWIGFRLIHGSQYRESEAPDRYQWITFGAYEFKLDLAAAVKTDSNDVDSLQAVRRLKQRWADAQSLEPSELRMLEEHYKTYAFPFSCLIFGVIGIPLGLIIKRAGRLGGFAAGIGMALLYYLLMIIGDFLVTAHAVTPLFGAWLPNAMMVLVTSLMMFLFGRTPLRSPLRIARG